MAVLVPEALPTLIQINFKSNYFSSGKNTCSLTENELFESIIKFEEIWQRRLSVAAKLTQLFENTKVKASYVRMLPGIKCSGDQSRGEIDSVDRKIFTCFRSETFSDLSRLVWMGPKN